MGGINSALIIWERSVIPFLLFSSENWIFMRKQSIETLRSLQNVFLRSVFSIGNGCPLPILLFDTATLSMELRLIQRKLLYAYHLEHLPSSSLASEVWTLQKTLGIPGLYTEVTEYMVELGLEKLDKYTKLQWKSAVNAAIEDKNHKNLLESIKSYKKLDHRELSKESYGTKGYILEMPLSKARTRMRIRANMVNSIKFNFQSDPKFTTDNWQCSCGMIESQRHIQNSCEEYDDLRQLHNLDTDEGLVEFFDAVLLRRQEEEHQGEPDD